MADPELRLTYPCYMPQKDGKPELIEVDGNICALIFTDEKKMQALVTDKYKLVGPKKIEVFSFKSRAELVELLRSWQPHFEEQGCQFIAFDVVPGQPIMYGPWSDLIEEVERQLLSN